MINSSLVAAVILIGLLSTFGKMDQDASITIIMANDLPVGDAAPGQTVAYAFVEITSGINFLLNLPKFQKKCKSAGAKVQLIVLHCATCGSEALPTNAMIYFQLQIQ